MSGQGMAGQPVTREEFLELKRMVEEIRDIVKVTDRYDTHVKREYESADVSHTLELLNPSLSTTYSDDHLQETRDLHRHLSFGSTEKEHVDERDEECQRFEIQNPSVSTLASSIETQVHDSVTANTSLQSSRTVESRDMAQLSSISETVMKEIRELADQFREQRIDMKALNDAMKDVQNKFNKMEETKSQPATVKILDHLDAVQHSMETLTTRCSKNDEELKDSVKSIVRAELVWMDNNVDQKFRDEIQDSVRDIQDKLKEELHSTVDKVAQEFKAGVQTCCDATKQEVQTSAEQTKQEVLTAMTSVMKELKESEEMTVTKTVNTLEQSLDTANKNLNRALKETCTEIIGNSQKAVENKVQEVSVQTEESKRQIEARIQKVSDDMRNHLDNGQGQITAEMRKISEELRKCIDETQVQFDGLKQYIDKKNNAISAVSEKESQLLVGKIDGINTTTVNMKEEILKLFHDHTNATQTHVTTKVNDSVNEMTENMYKTRRKIFAVIQAESQFTRDRVAGPLPSHTTYTLDFYIEKFKSQVRSGKDRYSLPCYINQLQSSVVGNAEFTTDGKMHVWLLYGRHPREQGLIPRAGVRLSVKGTITDINKGELQDRLVEEKTWTLNEAEIKSNCDRGLKLGELSVDELVEMGYGEKEGYVRGALLVRYEMKVI